MIENIGCSTIIELCQPRSRVAVEAKRRGFTLERTAKLLACPGPHVFCVSVNLKSIGPGHA
jgi:hypothetical protein